MRVLYLSDFHTFIFDICVWICIHFSIGYWSSRIPVDLFDPAKQLFRIRSWEKDGQIYDRIFHVKAWKRFIPSGAALYKDAFHIKKLASISPEYLYRWIKESCRAEFCHWMMIFPGFIFFLWNSVEMGWWMVVYAVANNLVPIVMQRYNRPRVQKLLDVLQKNTQKKVDTHVTFEPQKTFSNSY
jgi:glycosyl-4,4'-diaponeurosporenoate acyltransferase